DPTALSSLSLHDALPISHVRNGTEFGPPGGSVGGVGDEHRGLVGRRPHGVYDAVEDASPSELHQPLGMPAIAARRAAGEDGAAHHQTPSARWSTMRQRSMTQGMPAACARARAASSTTPTCSQISRGRGSTPMASSTIVPTYSLRRNTSTTSIAWSAAAAVRVG